MRRPPDRPERTRDPLDAGRNQPVLSVSEFTSGVRRLLEDEYPMVWISGELSNFSRPGSGHWYFTLNDADAQVRCAMFRGRNRSVRFTPEAGLEVVARGKVSLYEGRGDFQLIVDSLRPAGDGALRLAMERLRAQLESEGLLDPARRQPLPSLPLHIALVTSPTGAALQDMLAVLNNRYRLARITVVPVLVQGRDAPESICRGLAQAAALPAVDAIVCGRGGGSLEDLAAFNSELVARAIAGAEVPVVSAVGHETDVTIADLVADLRAPTPSAAIEQIVPDQRSLAGGFNQIARDLHGNMSRVLAEQERELRLLGGRLRSQTPRAGTAGARLQSSEQRLNHAVRQLLIHLSSTLRGNRLPHPRQRIRQAGSHLDALSQRLSRAIRGQLGAQHQSLGSVARAMHAVSPMSTLERGYSIVTTEAEGVRSEPVQDAQTVEIGQALKVVLARGSLGVRVESQVLPDASDPALSEPEPAP